MLSLILLYNLTWHCFTATQYRINLQYTKIQEQYLFIDLGSLFEKSSLHKITEPKTQRSIFCLIEKNYWAVLDIFSNSLNYLSIFSIKGVYHKGISQVKIYPYI